MTYSITKSLIILSFGLIAIGSGVFLPSAAWFLSLRRHSVYTVVLPDILKDKRIILIGASVGEQWQLEKHFPNTGIRYYCSPSLGKLAFPKIIFGFDKSEAIKFYTSLEKPDRPDAVIIKECAAYYPPNPGQSIPDYNERKKTVERWTRELRDAGIIPILATVVPVTRGSKEDVPGRLDLIRDYNDWVRKFAESESIAVLDLEKALRIGDDDRSLPAVKAVDGMHLVPRTYGKYLDPIVYPTLLKAFETAGLQPKKGQ